MLCRSVKLRRKRDAPDYSEGRCIGSLQVRATVDLVDADHLAARWEQDMFDLRGRVTQRAFYGTFTGTRMVAVPV